MIYTRILGTGSFLPEKVLTNEALEKKVETTSQWIIERTGIHSRHIAGENETALTMAEAAARHALDAAGLAPSDIEMIIVASTTPEKMFPATACLLQKALDTRDCPAFDLNATACAGFVYGVGIADQFIRQGTIRNALVIGSEVMSRVVDWSDRRTCVLFGDGAGAVVLGADTQPGIITTRLHADGRHADMLYLPLAIAAAPGRVAEPQHVHMQGNPLFRKAVTLLEELFDETLAIAGIPKSAVDWLIPHQANIRIIQAMAKKLDLPDERVVVTLATQGNTSSASIPLALDAAVRDGRIRRGELLLLEGFGGGLAYGSILVKY